jgi:hypothetical protein
MKSQLKWEEEHKSVYIGARKRSKASSISALRGCIPIIGQRGTSKRETARVKLTFSAGAKL